jgi:serine/threonine protein phosphatase PrpC
MDGAEMENSYSDSMVKNIKLRNSKIDDSLSGSTGITVIIIRGDVLYVANVGDSRAIIASGDWKMPRSSPRPTTRHPSYIVRERLKKCGARISTWSR